MAWQGPAADVICTTGLGSAPSAEQWVGCWAAMRSHGPQIDLLCVGTSCACWSTVLIGDTVPCRTLQPIRMSSSYWKGP